MNNLENQSWATERGIADETEIDDFVRSVGGRRVDELLTPPLGENADYLFREENVVIELKVLETEFGDTKEFNKKQQALIERHVREHNLRGPLLGQPYTKEFLLDYVELFRAPLARIAKKANRQIKETKRQLSIADAQGILICVNDNFRRLEPNMVMGLLGRILNGSCSSIHAMIYLTNYYVEIPEDRFARLLWAPAYSDSAPHSLVEFVNWLGMKWGDFCEERHGPFDSRVETPDNSLIRTARIIRSNTK